MDKVIEAMVQILNPIVHKARGRQMYVPYLQQEARDIAKALLNLHYGCEACDYGGKRVKNTYPDDGRPITDRWLEPCPDCRMLAILSQNQELPYNPASAVICGNLFNTGYKQGWDEAQQDMIKVGKDGHAFRRVKVQEDNNATE